jgi:hypothetical protein
VMSWRRSANICREGHASSTLLPSRAAVFSWILHVWWEGL